MFRSPRKAKLEVEIDALLTRLHENADDPKKYDEILARIEKLHKLEDKPNRVSAETWAMIGANLLGIVIIITHEYHHPITTRALQHAISVTRTKP